MAHIALSTSARTQSHGIGLVALVRHALAVRRTRKQLARLDAAALSDIGVSRAAAWSEANRPFWELPDMRRW